MNRSFITFTLSKQHYGIDSQHIIEVIPLPAITPIGKAPNFIEGFINLRGALILVINMRDAIGLERIPLSINNFIVNVDINGLPIGFVVDTVKDVVSASEEQITKPSKKWRGIDIRYIYGIVKKESDSITILDTDSIFTEKEKELIISSSKKISRKKEIVNLPPNEDRETLKKRADEQSKLIADSEAAGEVMSAVMFRIGNEDYAIDVRYILQTEKLRYLAKVPSTPEFIAGVMNMGGSILPVIDMRPLIGAERVIKRDKPVLIVDINKNRMGVLVDEIKDVVVLPLNNVKPPLESISEDKRQYIYGEAIINDRIVIILKAEELFSQARLAV
ncbi:MAG: purine-binding chemotaxis protein CheW [Nitrospirae bacterium]|nr:purine-binding chemotaxis protein CheW [Nitrospirota bacterium]